MKSSNIGEEMYSWASDLFPINRSITGQGLRETLKYIKSILPELKINEVKSGTKVFDWEIPNEWNVSEAYIEDQQGIRILDFKKI
jgi:aminopeptidase-like protein